MRVSDVNEAATPAVVTSTSISLIKDISSSYTKSNSRMQPYAAVPTRRPSNADRTDACLHRTVPTKDQIMVPETLLKKRKSQEKAREARSADIEKRKKVSRNLLPVPDSVMIPTKHATRLRSMLSLSLTIFRV